MKKFEWKSVLALALTGVLALGLTACGSSDSKPQTQEAQRQQTARQYTAHWMRSRRAEPLTSEYSPIKPVRLCG